MAKKKKASKSRAKSIEALSEISKAVISESYLEDILKLIVTVTAEVMHSKICSLLLLDEKKGELSVRATQSVSQAYIKKAPIRLGEGIAGRVAAEGKPIMSRNVKKDPKYINRKIAVKEKLCSLLSVPLAVGGKVIGVLNCYTSKPHKFTKEETAILTTVANQAAVAIRNTELMINSRIIKEELESRKVIERAKDLLMQERGLNGQEAYRFIQKQSMDSRRSMREIAEAILLSRELGK
jgi:signal transduction protein with GAF and PtsI domain